uniref:G-protein coupled receptors family 1 profile domain-containing protein n=1 Tax=Phocoena sinus TaxID=42100 RepID=A0A8C9E641_PHOSS
SWVSPGSPWGPGCCPLPSTCPSVCHAGRKPADPGAGRGGRRPAPTTYFFLGDLSAEEAAYAPVLTPRVLAGLLPPGGRPGGPLCGSGCLLLGHYPAVCRPQLTTAGLCWCLLAACCIGGSLLALGLTTAIFQLPFRHGGLVNHVFRDLPAVLVLACGNRDLQEHVLLVACVLLAVLPLALILSPTPGRCWSSWGVAGAAGRRKAFNTVASHLTVAWPCSTTAAPRPCTPGHRAATPWRRTGWSHSSTSTSLPHSTRPSTCCGTRTCRGHCSGWSAPGHQAPSTGLMSPNAGCQVEPVLKSLHHPWMETSHSRTICDSPKPTGYNLGAADKDSKIRLQPAAAASSDFFFFFFDVDRF